MSTQHPYPFPATPLHQIDRFFASWLARFVFTAFPIKLSRSVDNRPMGSWHWGGIAVALMAVSAESEGLCLRHDPATVLGDCAGYVVIWLVV